MKNILKSLALMLLPSLALAGVHIQQGDTNVSLGYVQVSSLTCSGSPCGTGGGGSGVTVYPASATASFPFGSSFSSATINQSNTGNVNALVVTSTGTGVPVQVNCNALVGGGNSIYPNGGCMSINPGQFGATAPDGITLDYSSITDSQVGIRPFHLILGPNFNDPGILVEKLGSGSNPGLQIRATSQAGIELLDTGLDAGGTLPSGKYKIVTCGGTDCLTIGGRDTTNGSFIHEMDFYREGSTASWSASGDANIIVKSTAAFGWTNYAGSHAWLLRPNPTMSGTNITTLPAGAGLLNQAWVADGSNNLNYQTVGVLNSTQTWTGGNTFSSMTLQNVTINGTCTGAGCGSGGGTALLSSTNTWTGGNTFVSSSTFNSQVTFGNSATVSVNNLLASNIIAGISSSLIVEAKNASLGTGNNIKLEDESGATQLTVGDGNIAVANALTVSGQNVCQANGTNCPSSTGGSGASLASQLLDCQVTRVDSSHLAIASTATVTSPCNVRIDGTVYQISSSATVTLGAITGTARIYVSDGSDGNSAGTIQVRNSNSSGMTCSAGCTVTNSLSAYPTNGIPLGTWTATSSNVWDATGTDLRGWLSEAAPYVAGQGILISGKNISLDPTQAGQIVVSTSNLYSFVISTSSTLVPALFSVSTNGITSIGGSVQVSSGSYLISVSSSNLAPWTTGFTLDTFYNISSSGSLTVASGINASTGNFTTAAGVQGSLAGVLNITTTNSAWNEPSLYINATANTSNNNSDILVDDGFTPAITIRETSQVNPSAKKWQYSAHNGVFRFENRLGDDSGFGPYMQVSSATFWNDIYVGSVYGNQNNNAQFQIQASTGNAYITYQSTAVVGGFGVDISTTGHFNIFNSSATQGPTITNGAGDASCSDAACTVTATGNVTFTFSKTYKKVPVCHVTEQTDSVVNALTYTESTTAVTITQTGLSGNILDITCVGRD